ncbi:hypothetical protein ACIQ7S_09615 [Streptomyces griseoluteus]|uniref:hypothetical protein n=1 Tax=Streptomyces griseoluteus TaxID=29306 RepID=UPI00332A33EF
MPDRSPRLLTFPPPTGQEGERGVVLLRERPTSPPQAPSEGRGGDDRGGDREDDNPYAPPPEDRPDQPWRPRHPEGQEGHEGSGDTHWGSQWSDRQPGRASGGFGERPGAGPEGQGGGGTSKQRWDPTDPAQRRARYALLSGMWAVFFVLLGWPYVSLLLGALALYWGGSSLRAKPRTPSPDEPRPTGTRPQVTAAVTGMITAGLALVLVAAVFTVQLVYRDYYTCVNDALTQQSKQSCDQLLPEHLRGVLGSANS